MTGQDVERPDVEWPAVVARLLANVAADHAESQRKVAILEATVEVLQGEVKAAQGTVADLQRAVAERDEALGQARETRLSAVGGDG